MVNQNVERGEIHKQVAPYTKVLNQFAGRGEGIGVAILDSGILTQNPFFKHRVKLYKNLLSSDSEKLSAHGSKVAGIITSDIEELGRNRSPIYCFRVANSSNNVDNDAVLEAFNLILNDSSIYENISLVNMSLDIIHDYLPLIQPLVNQLLEKQIYCVVAAGEGIENNSINQLDNVLKVGVFEKEDTSISSRFDLAFLNCPIPTSGKNTSSINTQIKRDSAYCAHVSAVLARFISVNNAQSIDYQVLLNYLNSIALPYDHQNNHQTFQAYST